MDLIDRKSVIDFLNEQQAIFTNEYLRKLINMQIYIINGMPMVDVEPVRHGKWIAIEGTDFRDSAIVGFKCTECGRVEYKRQPYCNCGAKME